MTIKFMGQIPENTLVIECASSPSTHKGEPVIWCTEKQIDDCGVEGHFADQMVYARTCERVPRDSAGRWRV